ncbi:MULTISPECIES: SAF domain-containing protein [Aphanizomenonaceae]|uniref:SAF domain-containing protein n=1 Tax=Dolichospermum heterosporum TAC447 TaxID=747523 RepID=A0ABY5LSI0_9CYAN|nr:MULTISPECIES: SAF domain-containing protein [Aphanizomenonaceae]MBE9260308.1 hypothetical protein [Dolichospermum sp. LEGE 00246]UUO13779.1 SAF domain-containing protein [Dolichospermum heterosporum TAC447]
MAAIAELDETITTAKQAGLPPKYYNLLLGKKIKVDVQAGTPVKWELLM